MCIYIYIYIYIHMYTYIYIYIYICLPRSLAKPHAPMARGFPKPGYTQGEPLV